MIYMLFSITILGVIFVCSTLVWMLLNSYIVSFDNFCLVMTLVLKKMGAYSTLLVGIIVTIIVNIYSKEKEIERDEKIKIDTVGYYTLSFPFIISGICLILYGCNTVSTEPSVETSGISREEPISTVQIVADESSDVNDDYLVNENHLAYTINQFTGTCWHEDQNGDGIIDTSLKFLENGSLCVESQTGSLANMRFWELVEPATAEIRFYNSQASVQYSFKFTDESLTIGDMKFYSQPMYQQYIDDKPLYVNWGTELEGFLPEDITIYQVQSGDDLSHTACFYYPGDLKDFAVYHLQYNFDLAGFQITENLFQKDILTKEEAVLWSGYSGDLYPNLGFSFTDNNGECRQFVVHWEMTGEDIHDYYVLVEQKLYAADALFNQYFPIAESTKKNVRCEMSLTNSFEGTAILQINKLSNTRLDHYFEMILTDLNGICSEHGNTDDPECEYSLSYPVGYFYITEDYIYLMPHESSFLSEFKQLDTFPPTQEYLNERERHLKSEGEHNDYFNYRLVCSNQGIGDVFGRSIDSVEGDAAVLNGLIWDESYHNSIDVEGDERHYHLWAEGNSGTTEVMKIIWKQKYGIMSYANWSGAMKDYIYFEVIDLP